MLVRQGHQRFQVIAVGHCTLRVGGRAQIGQRDTVQQRRVQPRVIGQIARGGRGGHEQRLRLHRGGGDRIDLIERVRHQHDRLLAGLGFRAQGQGCVEQPLSRAVQHHQPIRRDVQAIAAVQPAADRGQQFGRAFVRGVFRQFGQAVGHHLRHETGHRVARLSDGQDHGGFAGGQPRFDIRQQRPQTRERVVRQVREPLGECHLCLAFRGLRPVPWRKH